MPRIEISVSTRLSRLFHAKDVNRAYFSVFMIAGGPKRWMAEVSASMQQSASSVLGMRLANTFRVNQSTTAAS